MNKFLPLLLFIGLGLSASAQCPPQITCPGNIVVSVDPNSCDAVVNYVAPSGVDTCLSGSMTYNYTGVVDTFVVPVGINSINILAHGAAGGSGNASQFSGGSGAIIQGDFAVSPGDTVWVIVGQQGGNGAASYGGGGGGGSWTFTGTIGGPGLLLVAGGGGGAGEENTGNGCDARADSAATLGPTSCAAGLSGGQGGAGGGTYGGGGGAGWLSNGTDYANLVGSGGTRFVGGLNGASGGAGGFGGAGGSYDGGGGGSGFTGAPGGNNSTGIGGGAGSYNNGTNQSNNVGNTGNGIVTITWNGGSVTTNQTAGLPSGSTFPLGTTTNTFVTQNSAGTDSCSFTVTVNDTTPATVLGALSQDTICTSSGTLTLPNGTPAGGSYSGTGVTGNMFDPAVAQLGSHWVYYTDTVGCQNSDSVLITVEWCTGMSENSLSEVLSISPNPSNGLFNVSILEGRIDAIEVFDAIGKVVWSKANLDNNVSIDLTEMPSGVYVVRTTALGTSTSARVIKR